MPKPKKAQNNIIDIPGLAEQVQAHQNNLAAQGLQFHQMMENMFHDPQNNNEDNEFDLDDLDIDPVEFNNVELDFNNGELAVNEVPIPEPPLAEQANNWFDNQIWNNGQQIHAVDHVNFGHEEELPVPEVQFINPVQGGFHVFNEQHFAKPKAKTYYIKDLVGILKEEDCMYKTILSKDKREIHIIRCPKTFNGTKEELYTKWNNGEKGFTAVAYIPKKDENKSPKLNKKLLGLKESLEKPKIIPLTLVNDSTYFEETNKYFTKVDDTFYGDNSLNSVVADTYNFASTVGKSTCKPNIVVVFKSETGTVIKGITTGRYNSNNNEVEVIGTRFKLLTYNFTQGNFIGTELKRYNVFYPNLTVIKGGQYHFVRLKVKSSEESEIFGFKNLKLNMVGKTFNPEQFKVIRDFKSVKLNKKIDVVDILCENGTYIKFLLSDVEFLYLDINKFNNKTKSDKKISIGSKCKLIDDRRTGLKRGDELIVLDIIYDKSSKKRSIVFVKNKNNKTYKVFLKQLKKINKIEINKEDAKNSIKKQKSVIAI